MILAECGVNIHLFEQFIDSLQSDFLLDITQKSLATYVNKIA